MIAETSRQAYEKLGKKKLGKNQEIVYSTIRVLGRATDQEIAGHLDWPINWVNGRRNELFKLDMIALDGKKLTKYGNNAKAWVIKDMHDRKLQVYGAGIPWDD